MSTKNIQNNEWNIDNIEKNNIEMLDNMDVHKIIYKFNETDAEYPLDKTVIELFEEQVKKAPDNIAVEYEGEVLTYKQLNSRANYIGQLLRGKGVKPDDIVGIVTKRSLEMIIAIYGVLKSGAGYMPIDPEYPLDRVSIMLEDSKSTVLLAGKGSESIISGISNISVIDLLEQNKEMENNLPRVSTPNNLAYVIFTSGSTGIPKGVMIENRSIVNLSYWLKNTGRYTENRAVIQHLNYIFDGSVWEIIPCGLVGSKLHVISGEQRDNIEELLELSDKKQIAMVPSMFRAILEHVSSHGSIDRLNSIGRIFLAAETVTSDLIDKYIRLNGDLEKLSNNYGPSEATVSSTAYQFSKDMDLSVIPIGKPIANTKIYILNGLSLCGVGTPGELCIGGDGVARGYLNQPELTAEKFIENPFRPGERIYRTGDLACWMEDGNIEYIGRIDEQVKIRGFRIELGEIESKLREIDGIKDAAVIAREKNSDKYLCGYIIIGEEAIDIESIKVSLEKDLPEYMIPSYFVQLKEFPLTRSGKLDRKALPEPEIASTKEYIAPRNEVEEILANVFQEILGVEKVGIDDSFFELGGDSIKAILMISKLREEDYEITVSTIMGNKTISAISSYVKKVKALAVDQCETIGTVALTPVQTEFFNKDFSNRNYFNHVFMLESKEKIDPECLEEALTAVAEHHDMLRAVYTGFEQKVLSIDESKLFDLFYFDYSYIKDKLELNKKITKQSDEIQKYINLEKGPLLKAGLYHTTDKDYLFICIHHLVVDGISCRIILEDLNTSYKLAKENKHIVLPNKTMSFQQWSEALRRYKDSYTLKREISYWQQVDQKVIDGKIHTDSNGVETGVKIAELRLSEEQTSKLLLKAGRAYNTEINDLLFTALVRTIHKLTGQKTVSVSMEGHGREPISEPTVIDRTVGWFTSVYPVIVSNIGKSISDDICESKETFRKIPNHGIGYGVLKTLSQNTLIGNEPDVLFNYMGEYDYDGSTECFVMNVAPHEKDVSDGNRFGPGIIINGEVVKKHLQFNLNFNKSEYSLDFIDKFVTEYEQQLTDVIEHCASISNPINTASDLGEYSWNNEEFQLIVRDVRDKGYEIERIFPLTSMQEGMLYHKLMDEDSTGYVVQSIFKSKTPLDGEIMKKSINLLGYKHEVLRTSIVYKNISEPRQMLLKGRAIEFTSINLSDDLYFQETFETIKSEDVKRGFDLQEDSLLRIMIVKFAEDDYRMIMTFHHIIMDGWCLSILMNDLLEFYEQLISGEDKKQVKRNIQKNIGYEEYVKLIRNKDKVEGLNHWNELLEDYEGQSEIQPEGIPQDSEDEVDIVEISLTKEQSDNLDKLSGKYGVTINTIIEAAWGLIIQRYNNSNDVVFGKVVSGRNVDLRDIENMVGLFINTIPVRVQTNPTDKFSNVLLSLQDQAVKGFNHDYCSLAEIQKQSNVGNDLINTLLSFENYYTQNSKVTDKLNLVLDQLREQTNYPITLDILKTDVLIFRIMYITKKFNAEEVKRILDKIVTVLESITENPEIEIENIEILGSEEKEKVLNKFNGTDAEYPFDKTVIELFEEQVKKTPNHIAVASNSQNITYARLNEKSNQLARKLRDLGVKPNDFVAIIADRTVDTIIGLISILKAGGAYLPIDPNYPMERIKYILEDSNCKVLITGETQVDHSKLSVETICLLDENIFSGLSENITKTNSSEDLAYLIYTSGTTGTPKGVMVEHRSINRLVKNTNYVDFADICILQTGSLTFDASTFEVWGAMLNGGTVYIADREVLSNVDLFKNTIKDNGINTIFVTTALFNQFISLDLSVFDSLEHVLFGGEATSEEHVKILANHNKKIKLYNVYGPTETTTFALFYPINAADLRSKTPIGKPISNTTAYIFNDKSLCGIGIPGELCIGGDGVARGYLKQPELTAEKFIENPLRPGERIYRTGDLARWTADGNIEYLDRIDEQVKIRGFRIELGEIESKLREINGIKDATVIAKEKNSDKYLCGYIISEETIDIESIKSSLEKDLPEYMIPSCFVQLKEFPLTRTGKLDKRALPEPEIVSTKEYIAPRNEVEEIIANVFKEILGVEKVGIDDSFFELGGHSLRATRLINILGQTFKVKLNLRTIFKAETIRKLAIEVASKEKTKVFSQLPLEVEEA